MHYNCEGYLDGTAGKAMANRKQKTGTIKPLPKKDKVYDMTEQPDAVEFPKPRDWEIFLHYVGYHNPDMGIWVKVSAFTENEAKAIEMCQTITSKKVEITAVLRK